jgi:hypothetical protein
VGEFCSSRCGLCNAAGKPHDKEWFAATHLRLCPGALPLMALATLYLRPFGA